MSPANRCQRCGGPLPKEGVLGGSCPRCMLELGYETVSERAEVTVGVDNFHGVTVTPRVIGRYKVLRVIGEGGMGVVYEAEQEQPRRTVALKIIKSGMAAPESLQRFEQESHALGRLQHPGIAQIYEAGTLDTGFGPQPYFAMELIRGMAPRDYAESRHLNTKQRVEIMVKICDAVQHAHQRGLIHRDLKPANILVDDTGQPKILDFGVVRVTDGDTRSTLQTGMGQLIGTLAYMSPEQALADPLELDTRTDVYALGVILYELLAGRLPYTISNRLHETIEAIREADPVRLSVLNRTWRGDVETIVSKALEKDRTRRYASATGMAADLRRYLNDEPIAARPPSTGYQLWKFSRRHKAFVAGVVASFIFLAALSVTNTLQARRARALYAALHASQEQLLEAGRIAAIKSQKLTLALDEITAAQTQTKQEIAKNKAESLHRLWESLARASIHDSASRENDDRAALLAVQALRVNARTPNQARILVEEALQQATRLDPWTHNLLDGFETVVYCVAYSSDGTHIAAAGADGLVRVWDLRMPGAPPVVLKGHQGPVLTVAFSPDGEHLASGGSIDNTIRIWNYRKPGTPPIQFQFSPTPPRALLPAGKISSVAFSAHGEYLAAAGTDTDPVLAATSYTVRAWDLNNRNKQPLLLHRAPSTNGVPIGGPPTSSVVFSHNGLRLASGGTDNAIWIWDLTKPDASPVALREPGSAATGPPYTGYSVAFSPDDAFLAAATGDTLVRVWNLQKPDVPFLRLQDSGSVRSVAFSPDGHHLASAGSGRTVRIWDMNKPGTVLIDLRAHQAQVNSVAFTHDGARIASGSTDKTLRVWDIRNNGVPPITFNPTAAAPPRGASNLNTTGTPAPPATISPELVGQIRIALVPVSTYAAAFSAGPARLAAFAMAGTITVWDLSKLTAPPLSFQVAVRINDNALAISPDGGHLAAGGSDRIVRIWDLRKSDALPLLLQSSFGSVNSVAFSSDGLSLAVAGTNYERRTGSTVNVEVWDLRNPGAPPVLLRGSAGNVYAAAFSSDGSLLAVGNGSPENSVQIWDLHHPDASPIVLRGHQDSVTSLAFSRDGHLLAGGSADGSVRVWNYRNPLDAHILIRGPEGAVKSLAFSPDGKQLAATSNGGMRLFDLLEPRTSSILFDRTANLGVAFLSDGTLAASGLNGSVRVWPVWSAAADYLCTRVPRNLSMNEWQIYVGDDIPYERTCPGLPPGSGVPVTQK